VIVGGISFGTLFTLFVVPTAYTLLARTRSRAATAPAAAGPAPLPQAAE
jgi:multidrug efflux pump